jgi:hypothetical protein
MRAGHEPSLSSGIRAMSSPLQILCNIAPDLPKYISEIQIRESKTMKGTRVMKTFIVYNLDTGLPIAVGEAMKAEWARFETAEEAEIRAENLIAEEVSL